MEIDYSNLSLCACPAGPCEHYPYNVQGRMLQFRQGTSGKPRDKELKHLELFAKNQERVKAGILTEISEAPSKVEYGPGTELKDLLLELGAEQSIIDSCGCERLQYQMNYWGVDGCKTPERYKITVDWLNSKKKALRWGKWFEAVVKSSKLVAQLKINPLDPVPGIVDEAIRRAEKKHTGTPTDA